MDLDVSSPSLPSDVSFASISAAESQLPSPLSSGKVNDMDGDGPEDSVDLPSPVVTPSPGSSSSLSLTFDLETLFDELTCADLGFTPHSCLVPSPEVAASWLHRFEDWSVQTMAVEFYSVPRVLEQTGQHPCLSFDILTGWDFDRTNVKALSLRLLRQVDVRFLCLSPPCTMFSELMRLFNEHRMDPAVWESRWKQAVGYIEHSMDAAQIQIQKKNFFMYEHPWKARSWSLAAVQAVAHLESVILIDFDMCACGMVSPAGQPVRKRTRIMTNDPILASRLQSKQCPRNHQHRPIEGSELGYSMSKWCQKYPPGLVDLLSRAANGS